MPKVSSSRPTRCKVHKALLQSESLTRQETLRPLLSKKCQNTRSHESKEVETQSLYSYDFEPTHSGNIVDRLFLYSPHAYTRKHEPSLWRSSGWLSYWQASRKNQAVVGWGANKVRGKQSTVRRPCWRGVHIVFVRFTFFSAFWARITPEFASSNRVGNFLKSHTTRRLIVFKHLEKLQNEGFLRRFTTCRDPLLRVQVDWSELIFELTIVWTFGPGNSNLDPEHSSPSK